MSAGSAVFVEHLVRLAGFVSRGQNQLLDQSGMAYLGRRACDRSCDHLLHLWRVSVTSPGSGTNMLEPCWKLRNIRIMGTYEIET